VPESPDGGRIIEEMLRLSRAAAEQQTVEPTIHPRDFIYWFLCTHPHLSHESAINYYYQDGGRSADKLAELVAQFTGLNQDSVKVLEFASGYGCVSRHIKKRPQFDLVSSDIHPEAVDFLTNRIGVKAILSSHVPEQFSPAEKYHVVFALSFFSHMPKSTFGRWVRSLFSALNTPGYLVFTTHGLKSSQRLQITADDIPADGFWFRATSEQHDLDFDEYGLSLTTPDFVIGEIHRQIGAPIVAYKHAHWWDHQDLWVVKREKS